ncbi:Protein N-terminal and lysine N-methyltransferase efm7 [Mucor velutinosus]|uniref:Protein N-terminal and lysine N-methyltransferase efm7 n=1 Tax=Mucor velutinosus TaxID=708070 RepID=A0AAN7HQD3_9FUNG|nr:Protein N-terminal and lysine N-methyltransferase efm7 [Mucor velutinosus]
MASAAATDPKRLQNLYVARLVTQERPCFVCSKFTGVVLTSADNSNTDWFYVCRAHLGDFNFCSKLGGSPKPAQNAQIKKEQLVNRPPESDSVVDLVSSIGSAWKSWRGSGKKSDEEDDKKKDDKKGDDKDNEKDESQVEKKASSSPALSSDTSLPPSPAPASVPASPQQPVRFVIQRDYFYLRQREYMKKIQKKEASEKLKTLQFPEVPKTLPTMQK